MKYLPEARSRNLIAQESGREILLYDLDTNRIFALNETSGFVWKHSDGRTSVGDIARKAASEFGQAVPEDLVWLAIETLNKENLMQNGGDVLELIGGNSRRQAIKQIGLATMLALPFVTSITAPRAIHAQSVGGVCTPNAVGCAPSNNADLFVYTFNASPTPFCQFTDPNCQSICDAAVNLCCSCDTVLLPDTINAAFVCRCVG